MLATIRFWIAIVMLLDAAAGLWWSSRWQALSPRINVERVAILEGFAAMFILYIHYFIDPV